MLDALYKKSKKIKINQNSKFVVFSDLHIGNKTNKDDFKKNGKIFHDILNEHYYKNGYTLILNGDVEELYKFSIKKIIFRWKELYKLFKQFSNNQRLIKIFGNHDFKLKNKKIMNLDVMESVNLQYNGENIFIFHGHQSKHFTLFSNFLSEFIVRYIAAPLGIKNYSVAYSKKKKYTIEQEVYNFAKKNKIITIIGHTHRPLFESLSKQDTLKFKIEQLCRNYCTEESPREKNKIANIIKRYRKELKEIFKERDSAYHSSSLYDEELHIPAIFNSGCVIGKKGITAIEIKNGEINLVYWFDKNKSKKYFNLNGFSPQSLNNTNYYKVTLKNESLNYIFTRIKLLT